jgi:hypothetical protein
MPEITPVPAKKFPSIARVAICVRSMRHSAFAHRIQDGCGSRKLPSLSASWLLGPGLCFARPFLRDKFKPCDGVSPNRRAAPRSQPFLAAADDAQARRPPPSRGIQLLSEEVPRLSSKVAFPSVPVARTTELAAAFGFLQDSLVSSGCAIPFKDGHTPLADFVLWCGGQGRPTLP